MYCRACYKISKMSKNSPRSFVVRENRRRENGILSLLFKPFLQMLQVENQILHTCLKEEASAEKCLNQQWHRINAWISDKADQCEMNS